MSLSQSVDKKQSVNQLISSRERVSSVGDWNNVTIKHMIICAKHDHVKKSKKQKYELDANDSVRNVNKNLEVA
jgi:hypothetical protein